MEDFTLFGDLDPSVEGSRRLCHDGAMRWATENPARFIGLKAATTTATCVILDRIRRRHPQRAMFLLVGIDAAYAVIVAHNYTAGRR